MLTNSITDNKESTELNIQNTDPVKKVANLEATSEDNNEDISLSLNDEKNNQNDEKNNQNDEKNNQNEKMDINKINNSTPDFNRTVIENLGSLIRLVDKDEDNGLDLFCYVKCTETDDDIIKNCRGVVFNGQNLIMKAFPYTSEYSTNDNDIDIISNSLKNFDKYKFYDSHEGACIRMFYFGEKWYLSTNRKLNAFNSKWASKESFGTSFKKAIESESENNKVFKESLPMGDNILEKFQSILDKKNQYMFLVRNNADNRIVCDAAKRPTVFHVGTFKNNNLVLDDNINIPKPHKQNFQNINEIIEYVNNINHTKIQGVICFGPDNNQFKILHKDYLDLFKARGNEPSIKFRYLQVRMNRKFINMLYHLYPDQVKVFDEYENTIYDISQFIYRAYVQRFIKKRYVTVPREEFQVIKDCHTWHLTDRGENRITSEQVIKVLNQQSPINLNHMIRRFRTEEVKRMEQQNKPHSNSNQSISTLVLSQNNNTIKQRSTSSSNNTRPRLLNKKI
jgi:hypothetical protein